MCVCVFWWAVSECLIQHTSQSRTTTSLIISLSSFSSSRPGGRPTLNPSVVYFLPLFNVDEQRNLQTDLLLKDGLTCFLLCENLLLSLSILSLCACLTDKAYWTITGVTLPPSSFCPQTILPQIRSCAHSLAATLLSPERNQLESRPSPSAPNSPPSTATTTRWNEHFSRPETFNLALFWRELIETYPLAAFFALAAPSPQNPCLVSIRIMVDGAAVALVVEKCGFSQAAYSDRKS